jgi:glycine cleavage system regulatory protein
MLSIHLVLTIIARDKPGIVEQLSQTVADHGASWLGSQMARLAGEFAGIVEVRAPESTASLLAEALRELEGLSVQVAHSEAPLGEPPEPRSRLLHLELVGDDRPGIVREISQVLTRRGVNVLELATRCESAPMSGEVLFRAQTRLQVPSEVAFEELAEELEKIAHGLMVDLTLDEPGDR